MAIYSPRQHNPFGVKNKYKGQRSHNPPPCTQIIFDNAAHRAYSREEVRLDRNKNRRRDWTAEQKALIFAECAPPGVTLTSVARKYDINLSQLCRWRREARKSRKKNVEQSDIRASSSEIPSGIEVVLASGKVRVHADADILRLQVVIKIMYNLSLQNQLP